MGSHHPTDPIFSVRPAAARKVKHQSARGTSRRPGTASTRGWRRFRRWDPRLRARHRPQRARQRRGLPGGRRPRLRRHPQSAVASAKRFGEDQVTVANEMLLPAKRDRSSPPSTNAGCRQPQTVESVNLTVRPQPEAVIHRRSMWLEPRRVRQVASKKENRHAP